MSPEQSKAARAVLGWNADTAAKQSGVSKPTILNLETRKYSKPQKNVIQSLQNAYEAAGVLFTSDGLSITWRTPDAPPRKA